MLACGNLIHANRAPSYDYGWDGGAFEIYGASNVTMTDNVIYDNENILETGTDGVYACSGNTFTRNVACGAVTQGRSWGMFLRCGEQMLVANNTFVDVQGFVFSLGSDSATYSGRIDGLRILNNVMDVTGTGAKIYGLVTAMPSTVRIDRNLVRTTGNVATLPDGRTTTSQARSAAGPASRPTASRRHRASSIGRPRLRPDRRLPGHRCGPGHRQRERRLLRQRRRTWGPSSASSEAPPVSGAAGPR